MHPSDDEFRQRVRTFLDEHAADEGWLRDEFGRAPADDAPNEVRLVRNRRCLALLHDAGLGAIAWPARYGGQGLTNRHQVMFNQEVAGYALPLTMFIIGHGMCAPTLLAFGTDLQKSRFLPPLLRGDEIWCQLFSEPEAGSDLASVRCRARRDGDSWIVSGQKVWTSGAHNAAFGLLLARSDPSGSRHQGLTTFIVDMNDPTVHVHGLRDMTGATRFNEVFFDGTTLSAEAVVGAVGSGWTSAINTLMNERVSIGTGPVGGNGHPVGALVAEGQHGGRLDDPATKNKILSLVIAERLVELLGMRVTESLLAGVAPGPEGSLAKLAGTKLSKDAAALAMELVGAASVAWERTDASSSTWAKVQTGSPGLSIAGGTDEVMKNILAERVLGLPRDPRPAGDEVSPA